MIWFLLGFGVGWGLCSWGVRIELDRDEKLRLMKQWQEDMAREDADSEAAHRWALHARKRLAERNRESRPPVD